MGLSEYAVALLLFMAALKVSTAAVYKVGDDAGWTILGRPDYNKWAASKTFHVGDTIVFQYNPNFHNVLQVNHSDFQSCKLTVPIATYSTGKESITIKQPGHYYYLCGIPGHCDVGQKVDIRVMGSSSPSLSPGPTPRSSPSPNPSTEVPLSGESPKAAEGPSPSQSGVPALIKVQLWLAMGIAAVWFIV